MRILITGVPGWLGNRFLEILVQGFEGEGAPADWQIRCLTLPGMDLSFIRDLSKQKNIECISGDVLQAETLSAALQGVEIVFHLVGIIHPTRIPQLYHVNTQGTENLLAASAKAGVKRFVHISSNSVGGTNADRSVLMKESDPPRPYMHYGRSKYLAEEAVKRYQMEGKMEAVILRPCWYYGPNQPPRQTTFFNMIKKGNPIVFGDGNNLRSMSYLDNVAQGMILAAKSSKAVGQTYWIADDKPYSTNEIYETVADLLGVKSFHPRHVPGFVSEGCLLTDNILQAFGFYIKEIHVAGEMNKDIACSIDKAKNELGYQPRISLREGMRRSIEWCRKHGVDI